jgi:hypothetical protein
MATIKVMRNYSGQGDGECDETARRRHDISDKGVLIQTDTVGAPVQTLDGSCSQAWLDRLLRIEPVNINDHDLA